MALAMFQIKHLENMPNIVANIHFSITLTPTQRREQHNKLMASIVTDVREAGYFYEMLKHHRRLLFVPPQTDNDYTFSQFMLIDDGLRLNRRLTANFIYKKTLHNHGN
jgi:hypothetical protein